MALSNNYTDSYLKGLITADIEDAATEDIKAVNKGFTEPWKSKLIVIRAYILACGENCKSKEDLFHTKLTFYSSEYKLALSNAIEAYNQLSTTTKSYNYFSIPMERN